MEQAASKNKKTDIVFTEGPLALPILKFTLPIMAAGVLQLFFNAADTIVVGRYAGSNSLAAVGSTAAMVNLFLNLLLGLSVGANVVVAQCLGAGHKPSVQKAVSTSIITAVIGGIIMGTLGIIFAKKVLVLMSAPPEVLPLSAVYLRIFFIGVPFSALFNFASAILRAGGDTKTPLFYLTISGVVNVILNLIFVIVFNMNVAGVALATIISQFISAILVLRVLIKKPGPLRLSIKRLKFDTNSFLKIAAVGLPSGIQGCVFSLSNVVIQSTVNTFGSIVVAGNSASSSIEMFIYISMNAFMQTCQTFVGQNLGAMKQDRIKASLRYCLLFVTLTGLVLSLSVRAASPVLLGIYSPDPEVIKAGMNRIIIIVTGYFLCGDMEVVVGALRGIGKAFVPMISAIVGSCLLRILWIIFIFPLKPSIATVYYSYPVSWILTLMAHLTYWFIVQRKKEGFYRTS